MDEVSESEYHIKLSKGRDYTISKAIKYAAKHHVESFNFIYEEGLQKINKYLNPIEVVPQANQQQSQNQQQNISDQDQTNKKPIQIFQKIKIWYEDIAIGYPSRQANVISSDSRIFPAECRISAGSYSTPLLATLCRSIDNEIPDKIRICLSEIPIMVGSTHCHLAGKTPEELVSLKEDPNEFGGYFILNGIEKIIRMLVIPKRNYPLAIYRTSYMNRGVNYTPYAVQVKSVREDLCSQSITLHYISDGNISARIMYRKQEFLIPVIVILKALVETTDRQIYDKIVKGETSKSEISDRVEIFIRASKKMNLHTKQQALEYLGSRFKVILNLTYTDLKDIEVGELFLKEHILIHCNTNIDKYLFLCLMIQKLYCLVSEEIQPDNLDSIVHQEVLLSGHLYLMLLREKLEEVLQGIRTKILKDCTKATDAIKIKDINYLKRAVELQTSIGKKIEYFIATGNLRSVTGLDLMQQSGYTVIADKLNNMRYLSHFRSVHRGAYFAQMKTTQVRKLLPENWGFICPVHTPDGAPCGLLNHISVSAHIITKSTLTDQHCNIKKLLVSLGMSPIISDANIIYPSYYLVAMLDGIIIGYVDQNIADNLVNSLRNIKVNQNTEYLVPETLEIGYIPAVNLEKTVQYAGIYIYTNEARITRPVKHLASDTIEWISPFEQLYLSIAVVEDDIREDTTHQELDPAYILSILANNIPLLGHNQSPRNMYQCQMAKQTMGTPYVNFPYRFDNKVYRIMTGQLPIVRSQIYEDYGFNDYPSGANAVVAVISYTGYDMEDAMIINKSAYERGFGHGCVYKSIIIELNETNFSGQSRTKNKLLSQIDKKLLKTLSIPQHIDNDGLPKVGTLLKKGMAEFCYYDPIKNNMRSHYYKDTEPSYVDNIAIISSETNSNDIKIACKLRYTRNPVIGDKFSSRHGQKGVLSVLWPQIDMPFTESGITPDVIINPNAFPSRMTIGMLIESMAGKNAALSGEMRVVKPFQNYEDDDPVKYFGEELVKQGYNYYGNEVMYSGILGTQLKADIYIGLVYYQRLRHMVSDKSQARSTGPVDVLTQQPVKGRKKHGGIRLGEMERDALLAHGVAYTLHERLLLSSDLSEGYICKQCGSLLSTFQNSGKQSQSSAINLDALEMTDKSLVKREPYCKSCETNKCEKVHLPYVLRYLSNELAAMNIKLSFRLG